MRSTIISKSRVLVATMLSMLLVFVLCLSGCSSTTTTTSSMSSSASSSSSSSSSSASSSDALQKTDEAETSEQKTDAVEETTNTAEEAQQSEQTEEASSQQTRSPSDMLPSLPHVSRFQKNSGYALMIPKSDAVRVYVYGTSQQEFNDYAQRCIESGFDQISSRGTGYLNANNAEGYRLKLLLDDTDVMFVRIEAPVA